MSQIVIERLVYRNFKGFRSFELTPEGKDTDVFGDNGTGKTTLVDGFMWTLFGRDSKNDTEFEIKELDKEGKVLQHGLDHEVELVLLVDGKRRTFRRVFAEKWTKKRGKAKQEMDGHTTTYYVDGVSVKKSEYKDKISEVISEDVFKLITNPTYFNEVLNKDERRKILLEVCGCPSDEEIMKTNEKLAKLLGILNGYSIENYEKIIKERQKKINQELDKIPIRIDEAQRSMPDVSGLDLEMLEDDIRMLRSRITVKEEEMLRIQNGSEVSVKEKQLRELESELIHIKNQLQSGSFEQLGLNNRELARLRSEESKLNQSIKDRSWLLERNARRITELEEKASALREKWHEVNSLVLENHQEDSVCRTCGQQLPEDQVQEKHEKFLKDFNRNKSEQLEQITVSGKAYMSDAEKLKQENAELEADISTLAEYIKNLENTIHDKELELKSLQDSVVDVNTDPAYQATTSKIETLKQEIAELRVRSNDAIQDVRSEVSKLRDDLEQLEQQKAQFSQMDAIQHRIADLEEEQSKLAAEFERLQWELFLIEEFSRTKVSLIESQVSSKFKFVRFKLFNEQINGGLKDECMAMVNGVPYDKGLNRAAQINAGIDIINTLSEHYKARAPIFIDNAEAVTQLLETSSQVVRLVVSEADKKLRVEYKN